MKILIAGGSGFVGSNMLELLIKVPNIRIFSTYFKSKPRIKSHRIKYIRADLAKFKTCIKITDKMDVVLMLAGHVFTQRSLRKFNNKIYQNLEINLNMAKASTLNDVKKYFWLSSSTGYPDLRKKLIENDFFKKDPPTNYFVPGYQARFLEKIIYSFSLNSKITKIFSIRPSEIFGKYDNFDFNTCHTLPAYIRRFCEALEEKNKTIYIQGDTLKNKNYLFASDLANIIYRLINKKISDKYMVVNIYSKKNYNLKKLISIISKLKEFKNVKINYSNVDNKSIKFDRLLNNNKLNKIIKNYKDTKIENCLKNIINWYLKK